MFKAIVRLDITESSQNQWYPWIKSELTAYTATGFACNCGGKNYIITNAHTVINNAHIECQRPDSSTIYIMEVYDIAYELDLALLTPAKSQREDFWAQLPILRFADKMPSIETQVLVVGYPHGGPNPSRTKGIISRQTVLY